MLMIDIAKKVHSIDGLYPYIGDLYERWIDERGYESIEDYKESIDNVLSEYGLKTSKMTKRPFGFNIDADNGVVRVKCERRGNGINISIKLDRDDKCKLTGKYTSDRLTFSGYYGDIPVDANVRNGYEIYIYNKNKDKVIYSSLDGNVLIGTDTPTTQSISLDVLRCAFKEYSDIANK